MVKAPAASPLVAAKPEFPLKVLIVKLDLPTGLGRVCQGATAVGRGYNTTQRSGIPAPILRFSQKRSAARGPVHFGLDSVDLMLLMKLNPGAVVWEGWRREASPHPDRPSAAQGCLNGVPALKRALAGKPESAVHPEPVGS
jgi:hypothetical protein